MVKIIIIITIYFIFCLFGVGWANGSIPCFKDSKIRTNYFVVIIKY